MRRSAAVLAAIVIAASGAACSTDKVRLGGDLVFDTPEWGEPGDIIDEPIEHQCPRTADGEVYYTVNNNIISNVGRKPVVITKVSLVEPRNMALVEASLFRIVEEDEGISQVPANHFGYPPDYDKDDPHRRAFWDRRLPAEGTTVEPGQSWTIGVVVEFDDPRASMERIRIEFEDGAGGRYEILGPVSVQLDPAC